MKKKSLEKQNVGFNDFSERLNGRIAMLAIIILFALEIYTKQTIFTFLKLS